jgi:N-acetyltransferase
MTTSLKPEWQPTLIGDTIIVRPLRPDDWTALFAAASDPLIWEVHPVRDRYTEQGFRLFFDGAIASGSAFTFVEKATGDVIGSSRYLDYVPEEQRVEIGYTFLVRRHWGGNTNAEIKRLMLNHAFGYVDVVTFMVGEKNWRSRGAMVKIGGVLRDGVVDQTVNGVDYAHVTFEIRKPVG